MKSQNRARGRTEPVKGQDKAEQIKLASTSNIDPFAQGRRLRLRLGQKLPLPRDDSDAIYVLVEGMLTLQAQSERAQRFVLAFLAAGDVVAAGHIPPRAGACLVAAAPAEICILSKSALQRSPDPQAMLARELVRASEAQAARMALQVMVIAGLTAEQRVATLLIDLALKARSSGQSRTAITVPFSRGEMADYLALNADTLSRVMSHLRSKGLFQQPRRGRIVLSDWAGLVSLCPVFSALESLAPQGRSWIMDPVLDREDAQA